MDSPHTPEVRSEAVEVAPSAIGVILADTDPIYRVGLKNIFGAEEDLRVMAQVENLPHLYAALTLYPTDIVLLTEQILGQATNAVPELLRRAPGAKLVIQVSQRAEPSMVELYRQGARGVISRSISADLLVKCLRKVAVGETWIDNEAIGWILEASRSNPISLVNETTHAGLSRKQLAVVTCITKGMRNKEIAHQFGTTEQVIKNCLRMIYHKLGVSDRLELALHVLHNPRLKRDLETLETRRSTP